MSDDGRNESHFIRGTRLNARNLNYLLKVAESGSFSRAAIILGVTQSVLSRHVQELESELDFTIFHRNGRGLVVTKDGELIISMARRIMDEIDATRDLVEERRGSSPDRLSVGLIPSLASAATVPLIRRLSAMMPETMLNFQEASSGTLVEWLNDGRIDLACLDDGPMLKRFNPMPVFSNQLYLACHRDNVTLPKETPIADLQQYPLVLASKEHITRRQMDQVARNRNVRLQIKYESASLWSVIKITDSGLAMTILPYLATLQPDWQRSKLVSPEIARNLCIVTPLKRQNSSRTQRILNAVREELQRLYAASDS